MPVSLVLLLVKYLIPIELHSRFSQILRREKLRHDIRLGSFRKVLSPRLVLSGQSNKLIKNKTPDRRLQVTWQEKRL